ILSKFGIPATRKRFAPPPHYCEGGESFMPSLASKSPVTDIAAAAPAAALAHFERLFEFETDCWDVHAALALPAPGFVLLDLPSPEYFQKGHVAGAVNLPHGRIVERNLAGYPMDTLFV